jgi:phosphate-selective porin OprO/OprP
MKHETADILALAIALQLLLPGVVAHAADESSLDRVWSHATLYEDKDGSFLQRFALSGRLQADAAWFDSDQGDFDDILWRRFRFGFKAAFSRKWVLHVEGDWNLNEDFEDSYGRLTDAYIGWKPGGQWDAKILKQSAGFTLDGATSSKKLSSPCSAAISATTSGFPQNTSPASLWPEVPGRSGSGRRASSRRMAVRS